MSNFIKTTRYLLAALMLLAIPVMGANHTIDILVVYTESTAAKYGGDPVTRINHLFQITNQIYRDSNVDIEIRVAGTHKVNYTDENSAEEALHDITFNRLPAFAAVMSMREAVNADMVIFYRGYQEIHGNCGVAWTGGVGTEGDFSDPALKDYMYAHIAFDVCGDFMTAHELGHNMGLRHSHKQDGNGGTFPFALGHGENNKFATIMAYQSAFNADYWDGKVYKFSSPELVCKGSPCGVDRRDAVNGADAVYTLNITAPQIANFYNAKSSAASSVASPPSDVMKSSSVSSSATRESYQSSSHAAVSNSANNGSGGGGVIGLTLLFFLAIFTIDWKRHLIRYCNV
jgi:hypothetical protein